MMAKTAPTALIEDRKRRSRETGRRVAQMNENLPHKNGATTTREMLITVEH